jgi:ankyrin repeat protein
LWSTGNLTVVDLLISKGADVMIRDKDGVTPLMSAASQVRHPFVTTAAVALHGSYPI